MRARTVLMLTAPVMLAATLVAAGEKSETGGDKTAVYLQAGFSSGSSEMGGAALGGTIIRDLGSRLAIEGSGTYLGQGMGANSLSLSASLLVNLRSRRERAVPYLALGGGLYRASFDMGNPRFFGPMGSGMMMGDSGYANGGMMGGGMMGGSGYANGGMMGGTPSPSGPSNFGQMPMFYGNRLSSMMGQGGRYGHQSFTDPAVSLGGGLRIDLGSNLFLRPDGRALVVTADGDTNTVGVFTVSIGYGF